MIARLADALLMRVYHPVTAVVTFDCEARVVDIMLMDSLFPSCDVPPLKDAARAAIIFSHPDGSRALLPEEIATYQRIAREAKGIELRAYICGEDIGCFEVDSLRICGYNGRTADGKAEAKPWKICSSEESWRSWD